MNTRLIRKADEARKLIVKETFGDLSKDLEVAYFSQSAKKFLCYYETGQFNVLGTFNLFLKEVLKADWTVSALSTIITRAAHTSNCALRANNIAAV